MKTPASLHTYTVLDASGGDRDRVVRHVGQLPLVDVLPRRPAVPGAKDVAVAEVRHRGKDHAGIDGTGGQARDGVTGQRGAGDVRAPVAAAIDAAEDTTVLRRHVDAARIGARDLDRRETRASGHRVTRPRETETMLDLHLKQEIRCIRKWRVPVGRTNIVLDDDLIRQAMQVTGAKTKRQAVDRALRELVARGSVYRALRKLKGKMPWDGDVNAWRRARR